MKSRKADSRVFVIVGDGEMHEGSNWEALMLAGHLGLNRLCVLIDNNCLCGIGRTEACCDLQPLKEKLTAFNFDAFEVDGHDAPSIQDIIKNTSESIKPVSIICNTIKGKGVSFMESNNVWHYRPPGKEDFQKALIEIEKEGNV